MRPPWPSPALQPFPVTQQEFVLLTSPEVRRLIDDLTETRWTGRPGFPIQVMVGVAIVKSMYAIPTWTRAVRLIAEHEAAGHRCRGR